jgi:hypothetical protein
VEEVPRSEAVGLGSSQTVATKTAVVEIPGEEGTLGSTIHVPHLTAPLLYHDLVLSL